MAFRAFFGRQGAGKTYSMVSEISDAVHSVDYYRIIIVTNFSCDWADMTFNQPSEFYRFLSLARMYKESSKNSLKPVFFVYLDEAGSWFNKRDWQSFGTQMIQAMNQLRKAGCKFTYSAQHLDAVDKSMKEQTQYFIELSPFLTIGEKDENLMRRPWGIRTRLFEKEQLPQQSEKDDLVQISTGYLHLSTFYSFFNRKIVTSYNTYEFSDHGEDKEYTSPTGEDLRIFTILVDAVLEARSILGKKAPPVRLFLPSPFYYFGDRTSVILAGVIIVSLPLFLYLLVSFLIAPFFKIVFTSLLSFITFFSSL